MASISSDNSDNIGSVSRSHNGWAGGRGRVAVQGNDNHLSAPRQSHDLDVDESKPPARRERDPVAGRAESGDAFVASQPPPQPQMHPGRENETPPLDNMDIDDVKPPARGNHGDFEGHLDSDGLQQTYPDSRCQPDTNDLSENAHAHLQSFDRRRAESNGSHHPDLDDRMLPPSNYNDGSNLSNQQTLLRGRQRHRNTFSDASDVTKVPPLRFVHVPNNSRDATSLDARSPSVPDLISYMHNHYQPHQRYDVGRSINPLLSNETLRDKDRGERRAVTDKDMFEERLRRAHLRLTPDDGGTAESAAVTRYRSKSTPLRFSSRGRDNNNVESPSPRGGSGMWANRRQHNIDAGESDGHSNVASGGAIRVASGTDLHPMGERSNGFHATPDSEAGFGLSPPPALVFGGMTPGQRDAMSTTKAVAAGTPNSILAISSSMKSSDGSAHVRTLSGILSLEEDRDAIAIEPPPPQPPATEKERLVERERQARLETERARRRHLALQRERQMDEDDDDGEEVIGNDACLLGQVSFDAGTQPAPGFVGDDPLVLDLPVGATSSVGSSISIPRPPLPPPPPTERERLVERERQARLEAERARRRQALLRERQLEESSDTEEDGDGNAIAGLLGQVSFDAGIQSAPEFVGDSPVVLDLPIGPSSIGSSISIPRPPPPPPPPTERERLVERERQARLETERARRRQALLRERDLDDSSDRGEDEEGSVVNPGLLGQVSFDAGTLPAPDFVGDNPLILDLPVGATSSVGSSISIPRPPPPPPPPTERERLVERERQARLEAERARRRQALLRERELEESEDTGDDGGDVIEGYEQNDGGNIGILETDLVEAAETLQQIPNSNSPLPSSVEVRNDAQAEAQHPEAETNTLSYPMERFLEERVDGDDGGNVLHVAEPAAADGDLPYTMELFLAENAMNGNGPRDENIPSDNRTLDDGSEADITRAIESPVQNGNIPPNFDSVESNEVPPAHIDSVPSSGSVAMGSMGRIANAQIDHTDNHSSLGSLVADVAPDLFDVDVHPSRLTEADIARLAEVEQASIGNAAPQSVRDEPSVSSIVGRGASLLDHAFSVATQTTVVESVTEASEGRVQNTFSDINEGTERMSVIRVDSTVSNQSGSSGGASSASVEAMPSSADSSDDSDVISLSEGVSDSLSHSMGSETSHSQDEISAPRLTEADIETMAELENASITAAPHSIRDDRLSESSVTERGGRRPSIATPITEISSVDERNENQDLLMAGVSDDHTARSDHSENASVEAMPSVHSGRSIEAMQSVHSDHSIEVMPSVHSNHSIDSIPSDHDDRMGASDEDDVIVYQASNMGSSASIDAQPSIDMENDVGAYGYGSINGEHLQQYHVNGFHGGSVLQHDIESAPLLSNPSDEEMRAALAGSNDARPIEIREKTRQSDFPTLFVLAMSEFPAFVIIAMGNNGLSSHIGLKRYQMIISSLVLAVIVFNHSDNHYSSQPLVHDWISAELKSALFAGIFLGLFLGLAGVASNHFDLWFGAVISCSIVAAAFVSQLCKICFMRLFFALHHSQSRMAVVGTLAAGCQDFLVCITVLQVACTLSSAWLSADGSGDGEVML